MNDKKLSELEKREVRSGSQDWEGVKVTRKRNLTTEVRCRVWMRWEEREGRRWYRDEVKWENDCGDEVGNVR